MLKFAPFLALAAAIVLPATAGARDLHIRYRHVYRHAPSGAFAETERLIADRALLTPEQRRCSVLVRGRDAIREVVEVSVLKRFRPGCPAEAATGGKWFDVYLDPVSGSVQWTPDSPTEMQSLIPPRPKNTYFLP